MDLNPKRLGHERATYLWTLLLEWWLGDWKILVSLINHLKGMLIYTLTYYHQLLFTLIHVDNDQLKSITLTTRNHRFWDYKISRKRVAYHGFKTTLKLQQWVAKRSSQNSRIANWSFICNQFATIYIGLTQRRKIVIDWEIALLCNYGCNRKN